MFIKSTRQSENRRTCLCGKGGECKAISKAFRDLEDVRGGYAMAPSPVQDSRSRLLKEQLEAWIGRICVHWKIKKTDYEESLCYNKLLPQDLRATRSATKVQKKKDAYIALWHFPPILFKQYGPSIPRKIPIKEATDLGLYIPGGGGGSFYSKGDLIEDDTGNQHVLLVPAYVDIRAIRTELQQVPAARDSYYALDTARKSISPSKKRNSTSTAVASSDINTKSGDTDPPPPNKRKKGNTLQMDETELRAFIDSLHDSHEKEIANKDAALRKKTDDLNALQKAVRAQKEIDKVSDIELQQLLSDKNGEIVELESLKKSGMNRFSMSNPEYFEENKRACQDYYNFKDFRFLKRFIEKIIGVKYIPPVKLTSIGGTNSCNTLSAFEQILLTLFFTQAHFNYDTIGSVFGVKSRETVRKYIDRWMPVLGEVGDMLSSFTHYLDDSALETLEPESYIKLDLKKIAGVIDGKDFLCQTVRTNKHLNCAQSSNKVNHSAFRVLTWSLPCGAVIERTPAFFGRASEKAILRAWGSLGRLKFPKGWCILGDKGFDNTAGSYTNYNTTLHPSFLTNKRFSRNQVNHNVRICAKRYTCEVVYSRVAMMKKLQGVLERESFHHFESLVGLGHGLANICYGYLQKINNYDH
jgi:hypothetical protein